MKDDQVSESSGRNILKIIEIWFGNLAGVFSDSNFTHLEVSRLRPLLEHHPFGATATLPCTAARGRGASNGAPQTGKRWKCGTTLGKVMTACCEAFGFLGLFCSPGVLAAHVPRRCHEILRTPMCPTSDRGRRWHLGDRFLGESESGRWMDEDVTSFKRPHPMDMWILPQWPWFSMTIFRTDKNKFDQTEMDHDRTSHGSWVVGTLKSSNDTAQTLEKSWEVLLSFQKINSRPIDLWVSRHFQSSSHLMSSLFPRARVLPGKGRHRATTVTEYDTINGYSCHTSYTPLFI